MKLPMKRLCLSLAALTTLTLAGCAANKPQTYNENRSFALNVARAGGMEDIRDHKVPKDEYTKLTQNPAYQAAWASHSYYNPAPGVSSGAALTLGLLEMLFSSDGDAARNSIIAWMPLHLASDEADAAKYLRRLLQSAIESASRDLGLETLNTGEEYSRFLGYLHITTLSDSEEKCIVMKDGRKSSNCTAYLAIKPPEVAAPPKFLSNDSKAYAFMVSGASLNYFKSNFDDSIDVKDRTFHAQFSSHLPEWVFLYSAPIKDAAPYPVLYHMGKAHYFVMPK